MERTPVMARTKTDLVGTIINGVKVIAEAGTRQGNRMFMVKCEKCGYERTYKGNYLRNRFPGCNKCLKASGIRIEYTPGNQPIKAEVSYCACGGIAVEEFKNKPVCRECFLAA